MLKGKFGRIVLGLLLLGGALYFLMPAQEDTVLDDFTVVDETGDYVLADAGDGLVKYYKAFRFDFGDSDFRNWFGEGKWSTMTLLSPQVRSAMANRGLREDILAGNADFVENRIDAEDGAVRFTSVNAKKVMTATKTLLENNRLWFIKGNDLWFKADFFLDEYVPYSIAAFREEGRKFRPGPEVIIWEQRYLGLELGSAPEARLEQRDVSVPYGQWFEVKVHMKLDDVSGKVHIWQDGELVLEGEMQTLVAANSLLNVLEVGITASAPVGMLVDNVEISREPL